MKQVLTTTQLTFDLPDYTPGALDYMAQAHTDEMYAFVHLFRQQCPLFGLPRSMFWCLSGNPAKPVASQDEPFADIPKHDISMSGIKMLILFVRTIRLPHEPRGALLQPCHRAEVGA